MERKSKRKMHLPKFAVLSFVTVAAVVLFSFIAGSLSFLAGPSINGGSITYTNNDLICAWTASADVTQTNVSWYNGTTLYWSGTVAQNSSTIGNQYTNRDESWTCQVTMGNGTDLLAQNASISINNSAPSYPVLVRSGSTI